MNMVAVEIGGRLLDSLHSSADDDLLPEETVKIISDYVDAIRAKYPGHQILGIGIAAPGYVDPDSGDILYVGRARGWQNFPMRARLEDVLELPIIMENDTDSLLRVEIDNAGKPLELIFGVQLSRLQGGYREQFERRIRSRLPVLLSNRMRINYGTMIGRYAAAQGATHWFLRRHVAVGKAFGMDDLPGAEWKAGTGNHWR